MFVHTLGESLEFQHTPLQTSVADLVQDGTSIRVRDNVLFPSHGRFIAWCQKMVEEYSLIRDSGLGVYEDTHPLFDLVYRSATLVISVEYMLELVDYMRTEWPSLRFEAAYLLLTTHYITERWFRYPYAESSIQDRELLHLSMSEDLGSTRRDNIRQFVEEVFPITALQRLLCRLNIQLQADVHSTPWPFPSLAVGPTAVSGQSGSVLPAAPTAQGAQNPGVPVRPAGPDVCPLCGGDHLYRVNFYEHTGPVTKPCNRAKTVDGARKRCIEKHAFTGPLGTPCDFTETVAPLRPTPVIGDVESAAGCSLDPSPPTEFPTLTSSVVALDHQRRLLRLVLSELHYWYPEGCPAPGSPTIDMYIDSAQLFKAQLMSYGHQFYTGANLQHLQDRSSWQCLRVRGERKSCLVVYTTDSAHRLPLSISRVFKRMLDETVHRDGRSECTGIFVDDGHSVGDSTLSLAEATSRAQAELDQLERVGVKVSVHKTQWPTTCKDFVSRGIDSVDQVVGASAARHQKYISLAQQLAQQYPDGRPVPRRELASVLGEVLQQLRRLVERLAAETGRPCQYCRGTQHGMDLLPLPAGAQCWHCPLGGEPHLAGQYAPGYAGPAVYLPSDRVHLRGVRDVQKFMGLYLDHGLPATSTDVLSYAAYAVELRGFRLDSSFVWNYLSGLSAWHIELAQLVKDVGLVGSDGEPLRVPNPCRHPQVIVLLVVLGKRYKKPSKAKGSWALRQCVAIYRYGFCIKTRHGRHGRLPVA
eukprot:gene11380-biopygen11680